MDKPISVGDLVQVVRPSLCTKDADGIGHVFKVLAIGRGERRCDYCHVNHRAIISAEDEYFWWPLPRLKRIQPLEVLVPLATSIRDFSTRIQELNGVISQARGRLEL